MNMPNISQNMLTTRKMAVCHKIWWLEEYALDSRKSTAINISFSDLKALLDKESLQKNEQKYRYKHKSNIIWNHSFIFFLKTQIEHGARYYMHNDVFRGYNSLILCYSSPIVNPSKNSYLKIPCLFEFLWSLEYLSVRISFTVNVIN